MYHVCVCGWLRVTVQGRKACLQPRILNVDAKMVALRGHERSHRAAYKGEGWSKTDISMSLLQFELQLMLCNLTSAIFLLEMQ